MSEDDFQAALQEAQSKIGRNVLMFQKFEFAMKALVIESNFSGTAETIEKNRSDRKKSIQSLPLGMVVGQFLESIYSGDCDQKISDEDSSKAHVAFSYKVEGSNDLYNHYKNLYASLVADRNQLIHHLFEHFDLRTIESCRELSAHLDQQLSRFEPELKSLLELGREITKMRKILAEVISSKAGQRLLFEGLMPDENRLDVVLREICELTPRSDGWMPLPLAGKLLREQPPEKMSAIFDELGVDKIKNLKKKIEASPYLELKKETRNGSLLWFYRPKQERELVLPGTLNDAK